uniref:Uncharacterized protein n=1 Tax=Lepeophtheirus salmonis TaxID=72036 RepID=A0A0K2SXV7_LEPSM
MECDVFKSTVTDK